MKLEDLKCCDGMYYVGNIIDVDGDGWVGQQAAIEIIKTMNDYKQFKFTFDTDEQLIRAEGRGYIESYDVVRVKVQTSTYDIDFPCKTRQQYEEALARYTNGEIKEVYQAIHMYDILEHYDPFDAE